MTNKLNFKKFFILFLIIQPFLDCYLLYSDKVIDFIGFSPTTIIRMIVIAIYALLIYITSNKGRKLITIYMVVLFIYFIIHHLICINIDENLIYSSFKYSLIEEVFYFIRMLLPVLVIYIVYNLNITKEELKDIISLTSINVSIIIIVLNLIGIALTSYGSHQIGGNIFNWFTPGIKDIELASKGWFNSANQIGATIMILIIVMNYFTLKEPNRKNVLILSFLILSSMMLGTRTATVIACYIMVFMFVCYVIISAIHKRNISKECVMINICVVLLTLVIYGIAPVVNCHYGNNYICLFKMDSGLDSSDIINYDKKLKYDGTNTCGFIKKTPTNPVYYKEIYPCEDNINFWDQYLKDGMYKYANNRTLELLVTNNVYNRIKTPAINLFGMSRSRFLSAETYLEKDIYVHYYTIGILGIILFLFIPYLIPCMLYAYKIIKERKFKAYCLSLCAVITMIFLASYMSGHILDELIVTFYLGLVTGSLLCYMYRPKKKELSDHVLIVNDECMMGGVSVLLEDILKNISKKNKIDLLILHNHGTRLKDLPSNVNVIYGSSFFDVIDLNINEVLKTKSIKLIIKKIVLVFLIKTGLIKYRIELEREYMLTYDYQKEIAFKDGFCGLFTGFGNSKEKIQWLHSDYSKKDFSEKYRKLFLKLYNNFDKIIAVSKPVGDSFNEIYGQKEKTIVISNIVDSKKIKELSSKDKIKYDNKINLISVGRLHIDKAFDRVINSLKRLNDEGLLNDVKYRIIGYGYEHDNLNNLIKEYNLSDKVELLGRKENPYPYVLSSDLFIMSSIHESFGLVVVESLLVNTPVLSTKLATIDELLDDRYGMIVDNSEEALYNGIKDILVNNNKIKEWKKNLKGYDYDNKKIVKQIEDILTIKE